MKRHSLRFFILTFAMSFLACPGTQVFAAGIDPRAKEREAVIAEALRAKNEQRREQLDREAELARERAEAERRARTEPVAPVAQTVDLSQVDPLASDFYKRLGLCAGATPAEVRRNYRAVIRGFHPDRGADEKAKYENIDGAYRMLSTPEGQEEYVSLLRNKARIEASLRTFSDGFRVDVRSSSADRYRIEKTPEGLRLLKAKTIAGERIYESLNPSSWWEHITPLVKALYQERPLGCSDDAQLQELLTNLALSSNNNDQFQKKVSLINGLLAPENATFLYEQRDGYGDVVMGTGVFKGETLPLMPFIECKVGGKRFLMHGQSWYQKTDSFLQNLDLLQRPVGQPAITQPLFTPLPFKNSEGKTLQRCYTVILADQQVKEIIYSEKEVTLDGRLFDSYRAVEGSSGEPVVVPAAEWGKYWHILDTQVAIDHFTNQPISFVTHQTMAESKTEDGCCEKIKLIGRSQHGSVLYKEVRHDEHDEPKKFYNHNGIWHQVVDPITEAKALTPQEAAAEGLANTRLLSEIGSFDATYHRVTCDDKGEVIGIEKLTRNLFSSTVPEVKFKPLDKEKDKYEWQECLDKIEALSKPEPKFEKPQLVEWKQTANWEFIAAPLLLAALYIIHENPTFQKHMTELAEKSGLAALRRKLQAQLPKVFFSSAPNRKVVATICGALSMGIHYAIKPIISQSVEADTKKVFKKFELFNTTLLGVNGFLMYELVDYLLTVPKPAVAVKKK